MTMSMGVSQGAFQRMASVKNAALARLAAAEQGNLASPAKVLFRTGTLLTAEAVVGTLNGYFGNPKVGGVVGVDGVVGASLHTAGLCLALFAPGVRDMVGDTAMMVAHTFADAALSNYVLKVFNGFGAQLASKSASATAGYGGKFQKMAGVGALSADEASVYVRG